MTDKKIDLLASGERVSRKSFMDILGSKSGRQRLLQLVHTREVLSNRDILPTDVLSQMIPDDGHRLPGGWRRAERIGVVAVASADSPDGLKFQIIDQYQSDAWLNLRMYWLSPTPETWHVWFKAISQQDDPELGNSPESLDDSSGFVFRFELANDGAYSPVEIETRLTKTDAGSLASRRILIPHRDFNPEHSFYVRAKRADEVLPPKAATSGTEANVSFPAVGHGWRSTVCGAEKFVSHMDQNPPHWFYNVNVSQVPCKESQSSINGLSGKLLDQFADALGLTTPGFGFAVRLNEFDIADTTLNTHLSPYSVAFPHEFIGNSFDLSACVGMVSAFTSQPVPPWVMLTGAVDRSAIDRLSLLPIGEIRKKLLLADGQLPAYSDSEYLGKIFEPPFTDATVEVLGNIEDRTRSGSVQLVISSRLDEKQASEVEQWFQLNPIEKPLCAVPSGSFRSLRNFVEKNVDDGILMIEVDSVFQALMVLGLHRCHPEIAKSVDPYGMIRITHLRKRHSTPRRRSKQDIVVAETQDRLSGVKDRHERFRLILDRCIQELRCSSGEVLVLDPAKDGAGGCENWLRPVARSNGGQYDLPGHLPAEGLTGKAFNGDRRVVCEDTEVDDVFQTVLGGDNAVTRQYSPDSSAEYIRYLSNVRSCVKFPLHDSHSVCIGVICLHRIDPGAFCKRQLSVVQALVALLECEISEFWNAEQSDLAFSRENMKHSRAGEFIQRMGVSSNYDSQTESAVVGSELCEKVLELTGGYRSALRLFGPEHERTFVIATAGADGAWPRDMGDGESLLAECTAANEAIRREAHYRIDDTTENGIQYKAVFPYARSHMSLVLRSATHIVGVLGIDWEGTGCCDSAKIKLLKHIIAPYGILLRVLSTDGVASDFERSIRDASSIDGTRFDFRDVLLRAASMTGAAQGAIFLRDAETGLLNQRASIHNPSEVTYEFGEGLTGWVAMYNLPLRLANIADDEERIRFGRPEGIESPKWKDKCFDGFDRNDRNGSFMAVPIAVGDEVLGVLRLASCRRSTFGAFDQQVALSVASRLAGHLFTPIQERRTTAFLEFSNSIAQTPNQRETIAWGFSAIIKAIGQCSIYVRTVDRPIDGSDSSLPVLRPFAASNDDWLHLKGNRQSGQGLSGLVLQTATTICIDDLAKSQDLEHVVFERRECEAVLSGTVCCVPIRRVIGQSVSGVLICHKKNPFAFSSGDISFLESFALALAQGVMSTSYQEKNQHCNEILEAGLLLLSRLMENHPTESALQEFGEGLLGVIQRGMAADFGCVWQGGSTSAFQFIGGQGIDKALIPQALELPDDDVSLSPTWRAWDVSNNLEQVLGSRWIASTEPRRQEGGAVIALEFVATEDCRFVFVTGVKHPKKLLHSRGRILTRILTENTKQVCKLLRARQQEASIQQDTYSI